MLKQAAQKTSRVTVATLFRFAWSCASSACALSGQHHSRYYCRQWYPKRGGGSLPPAFKLNGSGLGGQQIAARHRTQARQHTGGGPQAYFKSCVRQGIDIAPRGRLQSGLASPRTRLEPFVPSLAALTTVPPHRCMGLMLSCGVFGEVGKVDLRVRLRKVFSYGIHAHPLI